ncbi:SLATT domain-containing protein [Leisingera aquaemixtae]|uniref:SMODS and SLOG-associating 2TM effector domain-containing protein n=1 Tax=Leisingera aquaemixtae TaxID=1396826 RepID=A0A0P1HRR6_9RHOB|nr:SLATT domain-containing protein [Leisingera aquaemixtae]CUI01121.1 hypothetical protein PHA8399_03262 [Leisingera aquaemixtae]
MINESEKNHFFKTKGKMEKTAYIRFNLAERMDRYEKGSVIFSALLSVYLICSSVALFANGNLASSADGHAVTLIGIIASVSLLVVNLLDNAEGRALHAREMRESAQKILEIVSRMDCELVSSAPDSDNLKGFVGEYHSAIERQGQNHQAWDNELYETLEGMRRDGFFSRLWFYFWHKYLWSKRLLLDWWLYLLILGICAIGFYFLFLRAIGYS